MASNLALRALQPGDGAILQKIRQRAFAPVFQSFRAILGEEIAAVALARADEEQAELLDTIMKPESGYDMWVVIQSASTIGFVAVRFDPASGMGEIALNAIDPDHAGQGVGTWMYEQVLDMLKSRGATVVTVDTGGDPGHAPARRAYEKAGFGVSIPSVHLYRRL